MAAAAAAPPESAPPAASGPAYDEEEEECRICRLPAEADRPLRHPCACDGSIRFVHDDCQFRWMATRHKRRCEVCTRTISSRPLYSADTPARLPVSEFVLGVPGKTISMLLPLLVAICVVRESAVRIATLWTWRVALARTFAQVHHPLPLCHSTTSIIALIALLVASVHKVAPYAVGPYARWVERLEARRLWFRGFDALQAVALVDLCMLVLIADMVLACILGFLPFSLGRTILWLTSCFSLGNVDELDSYTSITSVLLIGYGFIFSVGVTFAGLNTFRQYLTNERFRIAMFFTSVCGTFFRGIIYLIPLASTCLNLLNTIILHPLIFGWLLDICTSKMFGATMSERFKLLTASSFTSNAHHWLVGLTILSLRPKLSKLLDKILWTRVTSSFVDHDVGEPFDKFYFKKLPVLFVDIIFVVLVILVPVKIVVQLAPEVFPLDITYFDRPAKGTPFWQGLRYCAESLSGIHYLKFLIGNVVLYLEWLAKEVTLYWLCTAGEAQRNNVALKDQYHSGNEVNDKRRPVAVGTMPRVVLAWLSVVIFNSMIFFSISVGRRFLFAIPQLPVAGQLKSNDLFAFAVGFCIISTISAATRDSFAYMSSGEKRLLALEMHLLFFIWIFIIPLLIGLLVDLSLLSPFTGPDEDVPALGFFCTWFLGRQLQNIALNFAPLERVEPFLPCMAYFIDGSWEGELWWARINLKRVRLIRLLQDELLPIAAKLLAALGVPYVLVSRPVAVGTMPRVVLAWLSVVIFNSMIFFSISVGRRFLFAIPQLPVAGQLKSNDLFAFAVGFCIISTISAATRDSFAYMSSGEKRLLALEMHLLFFIWIFIIPLLIGLLVDLSLLSPFTGPDEDVPALGFFCTWFLGRQLQNIALNFAPLERVEPFLPCMAYFIDGSWEGELWWARINLKRVRLIRLLQDELLPIAAKLLAALGVPYVLAKGIFPRLGYSVAVSSTVHHFAWLGSLAFCLLCYLAKVFFIRLHDSIRDDRYATGRRLEDVAGTS